MTTLEEKIIDKVIEYTEPYRPLTKGEDGEWYGPWTWLDVVEPDEANMLREMCLLVQEYLDHRRTHVSAG